MKRRELLKTAGGWSVLAGAAGFGRAMSRPAAPGPEAGKTPSRQAAEGNRGRPSAGKFFRLARRGGHWWFLAPDDRPFFSVGMNHIDSSALRYPENIRIWRDKYGNSQKRWITEAVVPDLHAWGFNTIGWTQEVVIRGERTHRHSRSFTFEEYQWANMPYCHLLPFAETHQWEVETRLPDFFSRDFEDWCDYVARDQCARMADDPNLIGYFYVDCPTWVHSRQPELKGPLFDPQRLKTPGGEEELFRLATRYYEVCHDAIRRYDPNHLILGDRYEAKAPLPEAVLKATAGRVDVLSFQYFDVPEKIVPDLRRWHELTGRPVLLADAACPGRGRGVQGLGERYAAMIRALRELPCCVGWHLCGAYLRNRARRYGIRDEQEQVDKAFVEAMTAANLETHQWVGRFEAMKE